MGRLSLPDERLWQIADEIMLAQEEDESRRMTEKMAGLRCQSCEKPMPDPPSRGMRTCAWCSR